MGAADNDFHQGYQVTMVPCTEPGRPRLTYSSVIQSLVQTLTHRSPFLQRQPDENQNIAMFDRNEVQIGELLGQGNFSNVFEVVGFRLQSQISTQDAARSSEKSNKNKIKLDSPGEPSFPTPEERSQEAQSSEAESSASESLQSLQDCGISKGEELRSLLVQSHQNESRYAIKCLKPDLLAKPKPKAFLEAATDLVVEAKYLSKLSHPNILKVRGIAKGWETAFANGEYDSFFILIDRLEETLNQRIKRWRHGERHHENTIENKCQIALQIASALHHLHERNLIFRDLKPQNIGLRFGDNSVQLFDFGFCRELPLPTDQSRDDTEATNVSLPTNTVSVLPGGEVAYLMSGKGTRRYMAPECLVRNRYNLKADVYSWSMIYWELLTLNKPYHKYSKEQHSLFVCEGGDRPPLDSPLESMWLTSPSFHSSLSSVQSASTLEEDSIDFDRVMTKPIKDLLRKAWNQDVSKRLTMKQVCDALDRIMDPSLVFDDEESDRSTISNLSFKIPYGCIPSMSDMMMDFATDFRELSLMSCLRQRKESSEEPETRTSIPPNLVTSLTSDQCDIAGASNTSLVVDSNKKAAPIDNQTSTHVNFPCAIPGPLPVAAQ